MSDLILPDLVASQLQGLVNPIHLRDAAGKDLGYFVPLAPAPQCDEVEPDLSDEELSRIEASSEWFSTEEVLRRLENLQ